METNEIIQPVWVGEAERKQRQTFSIARLCFTCCKNDGHSENRHKTEANKNERNDTP